MIFPKEWIQELINLIDEVEPDEISYKLLKNKNPMRAVCKIVKLFIFYKKYENVLPKLCTYIKEQLKVNISGMYAYTKKWVDLIPLCFSQLKESDIFYIPKEKYPELVAVDIKYRYSILSFMKKRKRNIFRRLFHKETFEEKLLNWILENLQLFEE